MRPLCQGFSVLDESPLLFKILPAIAWEEHPSGTLSVSPDSGRSLKQEKEDCAVTTREDM